MPHSPAVATRVQDDLSSASWIREMFEKGLRLKAELGDDQVCDFSLGNPNAAPPAAFFDALRDVAAAADPAAHRYMPNAGLPAARAAVAEFLTREYGLRFDPSGVILTSGAAGATNVVLHAILDPGDEVVVLAPYFPEYRFYIEQAGGRMVIVQTQADFQPDLAAIAAALTPRTRAVLVNTPNNPTGAVYNVDQLAELGTLLQRHEQTHRPVYLISDDVYRRVIFDLPRCPAPAAHYPRTIVVSSYSKDVSVPGERLGYVGLPDRLPERDLVAAAATMLNRTLGFVNAPAFMQRVVARCAAALCDVTLYRANRDLLCDALTEFGYDLTVPGGALYAFPRTPITDDVAFVDVLLRHRILAVPGRGFGRPGHMRLCYCIERDTIQRALPGFAAALHEVRA
jgi:aspartate aminotransferase